MKTLIIGTNNEAKVSQLRGALIPLDLEILGLPQNHRLPEIVEDGQTAQENARKKATVYAQALNQTVLSMDNALYFDGLSADRQPGLHVRRIPGFSGRPTDDDLRNYYSKLIGEIEGRVMGHWEFAICFAYPKGKISEITIISPRIFTDQPSQHSISGYPLESLQIDPATGRYIAEMSQREQDLFWQEAIGKPLCEFVANAD